jgi:hypothetical protein
MPINDFPLTNPLTRAEQNPNEQKKPIYFREENPDHRAIHVIAKGDWILTGRTTRTPKHLASEFKIPLPPGEYTFDFPPASTNLSLLVIDPDPGPGTEG